MLLSLTQCFFTPLQTNLQRLFINPILACSSHNVGEAKLCLHSLDSDSMFFVCLSCTLECLSLSLYAIEKLYHI